eukprot:COSAG06_NODE_55657_length_288_cov_1.100529_1_plen_67_part_01
MRFVVENGFCQDRLMKRSIDLRQAAADGLVDKMSTPRLGGDALLLRQTLQLPGALQELGGRRHTAFG